MFKRIRFIATALVANAICAQVSSQNLISHGNFEASTQFVRYQQIIGNFNQTTFATGWTTPTSGTPDLFDDGTTNPFVCGSVYDFASNNEHKCCFPQVCAGRNQFGAEEPRDHVGDPDWSTDLVNENFVGLGPGQEYIQQHLSTTLTAGVTYQLSFWCSLADLSPYSFRMQALFSNLPLADPNNGGFMNYSSDPMAYVVTASNFIDNKEGWAKVELQFTASGNERYVTIGVFSNSIYNSAEQYYEFLSQNNNFIGDCITGSGPNGCGGDAASPSLTWIDANGITHTACTGYPPGTLCQANINYVYIDDVFLRAICVGFNNPVDYLNATLNSSNSATNANILLTGNISISGNVSFAGCTVRCNPGTFIDIPSGSSLQLSNGTILSGGCNNLMWYGIRVNPGGSLIINSATIEDAMVAIQCDAGFLSINRGTFSKNKICINWFNATTQVGQSIISSSFDMQTPLIDPSQGISLKGIEYDQGNLSTALQVGGSGFGQGCVFTGGTWAIRASNANVNIVNSTISSTTQSSVDFKGNNPNNVIRNLKVIGCNFSDNKSHIKSYFKTDLTVESSTFSNCAEHGIQWFYNPDCHLKIGDDNDPNKGNVFNNNGWTAVVTFGNTTAQSNANFLGDEDYYGLWTDIIISNNKVNGPSWATGFFITESALGSNVSYQFLSISHNVMSGVNEGIHISNVRGYGGVIDPNNLPPNISVPPTSWMNGNQILISTVISTNSTCIKIDNAPGLNVSQNGLDSDNRLDWRNTGLFSQFSENTEIVNNFVGAGTGIVCGGSMLWSNVHCNTCVGNEAGIVLGWCALRPITSNTINLHGSNIESYPNNFVLTNPWSVNIHDYYSNPVYNQWVWSTAVTPTYPLCVYTGVTGTANQTNPSTSIISNVTGPFLCPGDPYRVAYAVGPNVDGSFDDADLQWRADYNYQVVKNNTNQGNNSVASPNIKRIIRIENAINGGDYALASAQLNGLNATNLIEQNYKTVLEIMLNVNSPTKRDLNVTEVNTLTQIAEQNSRTAGAAVTLARGILFFQLNMKFRDEDYSLENRVKGTAYIQTPCCLAPASGTQLTFADQFGNLLPISPTVVDENGEFTFDPYQLKYYNAANPGTLYRITSAPGSKFTVLNKDFKTLNDWILASPIEIILGGVKQDYVTTSLTQNTTIASNSTVTDVDGNIYSVGTSPSSSGSDFQIEKRNPAGNILWTRNYHGHVNGNDSATCATFGTDGFLYVAGKVWNGSAYNYATVKYDTTGFMQWETILDDTVYSDAPTAIGFYASDTSVIVTGRCGNSTNVHYKTVKYKQCVTGPNSSRLAHESQPEIVVPKTVNYYPNPNNGSITIDTKGVGCSITLFNVNGQQVWTKGNLIDGVVEFPENQVPDGVYLCKFTMSDGQTQFEKLIIQRN